MNIWLVIALAKRHGYEAALHQAKPNVGYTIPAESDNTSREMPKNSPGTKML